MFNIIIVVFHQNYIRAFTFPTWLVIEVLRDTRCKSINPRHGLMRLVAELGFEPRSTGYEPVKEPLLYSALFAVWFSQTASVDTGQLSSQSLLDN